MQKELDLIDISGREKRERNAGRRNTGKRQSNNARRNLQKQNMRREQTNGRNKIKYKRRRRKKTALSAGVLVCMLLLTFILCFAVYHLIRGFGIGAGDRAVSPVNGEIKLTKINYSEKPQIIEDMLTVNPYSRPGEELPEVKNIFVHYTANQGTSAAQNRSYFENLALTGETSSSAHFIIGYDGEIIQCIPLNEIGYAVKERNYDSISIECCYLDENGKFTDATYQSLIKLCGWLLKEYELTPDDMLRHYDEGGKLCPLYYVEHQDAWEQFITDLEAYILKTGSSL